MRQLINFLGDAIWRTYLDENEWWMIGAMTAETVVNPTR